MKERHPATEMGMNLKNQELFDYFANEHGLILLESEMKDIVRNVISTQWISVNNKLPTHIYSVLAYVVGGGLAKYGEPMIDIVAYNPRANVWLQNVGDAGDEIVTVTHWMDLPDCPTE